MLYRSMKAKAFLSDLFTAEQPQLFLSLLFTGQDDRSRAMSIGGNLQILDHPQYYGCGGTEYH